MKYLLMIIMAVSCILISYLINKSKRNRECILNEIKNSTKACEISEYFAQISNTGSKYLNNFKSMLSDLTSHRKDIGETHDKILKDMPNIFNKNNDSAFLMKYLNAVNEEASEKLKTSIAQRCDKLIQQNKDEIKSNLYIAIAIAVILIILAI